MFRSSAKLTVAFAATAAALALAGCSDSDTATSDEDQIREVVQAQEDAIQSADVDAFVATFCADVRKDTEGQVDQETFDAIKEAGETNVEVTKIEVDGDKATVSLHGTIGGEEQGESTANFVKEDGEWKDCT